MYIPKHFAKADGDKITQFIQENNFAELICQIDGRPFATHLPFLYDPASKSLALHMAKANPHWKHLEGQEVLLIVSGPHGYISPTWYKSAGVPTWNYQAVHIYGSASLVTVDEDKKAIVDELSYLAEKNSKGPWHGEYAASMLTGIVGIKIEITEIQCKFKLSQNRSLADQESVIAALEKEGNLSLAQAIANESLSTS